jgi:hypothetical protein
MISSKKKEKEFLIEEDPRASRFGFLVLFLRHRMKRIANLTLKMILMKILTQD